MNERINVTRAFLPPMEEYIKELNDIWDSHWITNMGSKHNALQHGLQDYLGVHRVELLANGHMALELTLQAMELSGEVITTPFTFASTTHAIMRNGLTPVFCDIKKDDYTIDANQIESLITDKTTAILPVHVYGNLCDVNKIQEIADKYCLKVVYDAAHTFGESYMGQSFAQFGDASIYSFHATKVFNTIEGGAVCSKDDMLCEKIYNLKNFGIRGLETVESVGANAKMNEFEAAMGICNLRHIDEVIQKRRGVCERYLERLHNLTGIKTNNYLPDIKYNYAYFPIVVDEAACGITRDDIYNALVKENIYARKYFYPLTSKFECFKGQFDSGTTSVAEYISNRVLTLPVFDDLSLDIVDLICDVIKDTIIN